jgi:hypothetical protein
VISQTRFLTEISKSKWVLLVASLVLWLGAAALIWPGQTAVLNWDEVDYLNAAELGVWANAVDAGSFSVPDFLRLANAKRSGRAYNPPWYDEVADPFLMRHFHPPFVIYLEALIVRWFNHPSERVVRLVQLVGAFAFILAVLAAYRNLSGRLSLLGTIVSGSLAVWMSLSLFSSLQFHGWAAVWAVAAPAFLSQLLRDQKRSTAGWLCLSLALGAITLETGAIVLFAVCVCLFIWKPENLSRRERQRAYLAGLALIIFFVVVIWPSALLKLTALKTMAMYLYRFRLGNEYSSVQYGAILKNLAPVLVVIAPAGLWLAYANIREARRWGPFVVIGVIYAVALIKFAVGFHYLLPAFGPLAVASGLAIDRISAKGLRITGGVAVVLVIGISLVAGRSGHKPGRFRNDLELLKSDLQLRETLAVGAPIFHYYLGDNYSIQPIFLNYDGTLRARRSGAYVPLTAADVAGKMIIVMDRPGYEGAKAPEQQLLAFCQSRNEVTIRVYDCNR